MTVQNIIDEAQSWLGTPYHPHGRLKGVGVDCAMLLAEVYERAGVVARVDPGTYSPQFGLHRSEEQFIAWVERYGVEVSLPAAGRVVLFLYGRCYSHGGVMIDDVSFIHACLGDRMVLANRLDEPLYRRRGVKFYEVRA